MATVARFGSDAGGYNERPVWELIDVKSITFILTVMELRHWLKTVLPITQAMD